MDGFAHPVWLGFANALRNQRCRHGLTIVVSGVVLALGLRFESDLIEQMHNVSLVLNDEVHLVVECVENRMRMVLMDLVQSSPKRQPVELNALQ